MIFISRRRGAGPLVRGDTPGEKFARMIALVAIFAVVGWLFWHNSSRTMDTLQTTSTVWDQTKTLTKEQRRALQDYAILLKDEYGLVLRVQIATERIEEPEQNSKTLFLGLCPATRQVVVRLPPLVAKAVGEDLATELRERHFGPYFDENRWPTGLAAALTRLWNAMRDVNGSAS